MPDAVRFTECMSGWLAAVDASRDASREAYAQSVARGRASGGEGSFVLTVVTPDVDAMIADEQHRSPAYGCVFLPVHARPLRVEEGSLDLFVDVLVDGSALVMRYALRLRDEDGGRWYLAGCKDVLRRAWWPTVATDTTTLFVDVWRGEAPIGEPQLRGLFTMGPGGVLAQGLTFRGTGAWFGLRGIVRYLAYYVRRVARVYTGPRRPADGGRS
jgi:hypothetical protein